MSLTGFVTLSEMMYNETNFYHRLTDINKSKVPMTSHCYKEMTSNEMTLFEDSLYLVRRNTSERWA